MIFIGQTVMFRGFPAHIQDIDHIAGLAKIGKIDQNGIVWKTEWVGVYTLDFIESDGKNNEC